MLSTSVKLKCNEGRRKTIPYFQFPKGTLPGYFGHLPPAESSFLEKDSLAGLVFLVILPAIAGLIIFLFFLLTSGFIVYGLIRHFYTDHMLPKQKRTLRKLGKLPETKRRKKYRGSRVKGSILRRPAFDKGDNESFSSLFSTTAGDESGDAADSLISFQSGLPSNPKLKSKRAKGEAFKDVDDDDQFEVKVQSEVPTKRKKVRLKAVQNVSKPEAFEGTNVEHEFREIKKPQQKNKKPKHIIEVSTPNEDTPEGIFSSIEDHSEVYTDTPNRDESFPTPEKAAKLKKLGTKQEQCDPTEEGLQRSLDEVTPLEEQVSQQSTASLSAKKRRVKKVEGENFQTEESSDVESVESELHVDSRTEIEKPYYMEGSSDLSSVNEDEVEEVLSETAPPTKVKKVIKKKEDLPTVPKPLVIPGAPFPELPDPPKQDDNPSAKISHPNPRPNQGGGKRGGRGERIINQFDPIAQFLATRTRLRNSKKKKKTPWYPP